MDFESYMEVVEVIVGHQKAGARRNWRETTMRTIRIHRIGAMLVVGKWCHGLMGTVRWD